MPDPKIVIPDDYPPVFAPSLAYKKLVAKTPVEYYSSLPGSGEQLIERIGTAEVVINIRSSSKFTDNVFKRCLGLRLVSLWGTGTDNVDLAAAARYGVTVTNTPAVSATSIAEHALMLMLALARNITRVDARTRQGLWPRGAATQLSGKTIGIIGLGAIGQRLLHMTLGIGMLPIAWTFHPAPHRGCELVDKDDLLRRSDVISVHLRLTPEARGFIGKREFELMKPTAILINTARGPIVDEPALIEALQTRRIAGAGLDVFDTEPLPADHPLLKLDNAVLTPHSAGVTPEALEAGLQLAVENVWNFLAGHPTNVVAGPQSTGSFRKM
jgi:phosphoglycerate dehydrogenase-like enzyme